MDVLLKECSIFTNYIVKDYGAFKKHIVFKNNIKKKNFEELDKDGTKFFDDEKRFYDNLNEFDKGLYNQGLLNFGDVHKEENIRRSCRRAKDKVFNIGILNDWDYFITLTFSAEKVKSRYDLDDLKNKTLEYFKNQSKKNNVKYIIIPELHADGALHWHGFIKDTDNKIRLRKTDKISNSGKDIYNIISWERYKGWTTAVFMDKDLESRSKMALYISKYITKGEKIFDKYYYSSNSLITEPKISYPCSVDISIFLGEDAFENEFCFIKTIYDKEKEEEKYD